MEEITPLKPMRVGELLDKAFRIYREKFGTLIGIAAIPLLPLAIIQALGNLLMVDPRAVSSTNPNPALMLQQLGGTGIQCVTLLILVVCQTYLVAALITAASQTYLRLPVGIASAYKSSSNRFWNLLGTNLLFGLAIGLPVGLLFGCGSVAAAMSMIGGGGWETIALLAIPGLPILAGVIFLGTRWGLAIPTVVLQPLSPTDSLGRSWKLTNGFFWKVLGTSVAATLLVYLISLIPGMGVVYITQFLNLPYGVNQALQNLVSQLLSIITTPLSLTITTLIYYDLRIRKEGFDLEYLAQRVQTAELPHQDGSNG